DNFSFESLKLYPNPTKNTLNVSYNQEISNVEVYNLVGQRVANLSPNANEGQLDMSNLASGAYFVKVTSNNATKTVKVIKE
ncbi:T9SS type A sorting domain-containing protein, partial [Flavobacterium macrobrachii]